MKFFITIFIALFAESFCQQSTLDSLTYNVAVIEYAYEKSSGLTDDQITKSNWNQYSTIMDSLPGNIDIVVFPEMTLNKMMTAFETPEPESNNSPCDNSTVANDNLLKLISCAAKNHHRYLVVNVITKAKCPDGEMIENKDTRNCTDRSDGFSYYNTNLVFDRNGTIISRYRKFNLFGEEVDKPFKPALQTFETDFGVTFGHFVCFDMMFRSPALELVRSGITDIIFPTMWFSELPFLTAVQVQQNWAYVNNVNLIAAGANNPLVGSSGSGIYAGRKGPLGLTMQGTNETNVLIAEVPKRISKNSQLTLTNKSNRYSKMQMKPLKLKRDQLDRYSITFLKNPEVGSQIEYSQSNCHNNFCCNFNLTYGAGIIHEKYYQYATAVYHGNRTFDGFADGGVVACTIIACQSRNISTCGVRDEDLENNFDWLKIEISGRFPNKDGQFFYMPTSVDTSILPLSPDEFSYKSVVSPSHEDNEAEFLDIEMSMTKYLDRELLAFGIYGRDFNLDTTDGETDAGIYLKSSNIFAVISVIFTILFQILI